MSVAVLVVESDAVPDGVAAFVPVPDTDVDADADPEREEEPV